MSDLKKSETTVARMLQVMRVIEVTQKFIDVSRGSSAMFFKDASVVEVDPGFAIAVVLVSQRQSRQIQPLRELRIICLVVQFVSF